MDSEGIVKSVDGIYKNILEKFNPGAKQLIGSSKSYLKSLHNTSAASKVFIESLAKLAVHAHEGGPTDIGKCLIEIVGVFSSIEEMHMNALRAFYVDFILPIENNIEKDTKVVQNEQKKFSQLHKQRIESFNKATTAMKKNRKKKNNAEKELKCIQALEEEKKLLDIFCDQSLKNALIQERRRYGFVLERCVQSMAKHWQQYFETGQSSISSNIEWWTEIADTREMIPTNLNLSAPEKPSEQRNNNSSNSYDSVNSVLRKSQSLHASNGSIGDIASSKYQMPRPRAKSEISVASSPQQNNLNASIATALYSYTSSGENQLSFQDGDRILLIGEKAQGWQFGENMQTSVCGWFPISYVQHEIERRSSFMDLNNEENESSKSAGKTNLPRNQEASNEEDSFLNGYQKIENPPSSVPPPPPSKTSLDSTRLRGSATTNFSKSVQKEVNDNKPPIHAIYSSNDSGFSNEIPPAPEIDYSDDDDLPRKIPIRDPHLDRNINALSDTEKVDFHSRSSLNLKQSNSYGNLTESSRTMEQGFSIDTTMKRNKSFWRFSKSEDILEGMALWKHRDLVPIDAESAENKDLTLKRPIQKMETLQKKKSNEDTIKRKTSNKNSIEEEKRRNDLRSNGQNFNGTFKKERKNNFMKEDDIYDESPKRRNDMGPAMKSQSQMGKNNNNSNKYSREIQDTNFYDDEMMVVKTVKRKEILKQYYSSGTDTELSSSDPYDCIIVDDHLVPNTSAFRNRNSIAAESDKRGSVYSRSSKNDISGTLLPRTKLSKSSRKDSTEHFNVNDRMNTARSNKASRKSQNWSNLWPDE